MGSLSGAGCSQNRVLDFSLAVWVTRAYMFCMVIHDSQIQNARAGRAVRQRYCATCRGIEFGLGIRLNLKLNCVRHGIAQRATCHDIDWHCHSLARPPALALSLPMRRSSATAASLPNHIYYVIVLLKNTCTPRPSMLMLNDASMVFRRSASARAHPPPSPRPLSLSSSVVLRRRASASACPQPTPRPFPQSFRDVIVKLKRGLCQRPPSAISQVMHARVVG